MPKAPKGPPEEVQIATLLARVGGSQATAALLAPLDLRPKQFRADERGGAGRRAAPG
jgi:hypothetical protein